MFRNKRATAVAMGFGVLLSVGVSSATPAFAQEAEGDTIVTTTGADDKPTTSAESSAEDSSTPTSKSSDVSTPSKETSTQDESSTHSTPSSESISTSTTEPTSSTSATADQTAHLKVEAKVVSEDGKNFLEIKYSGATKGEHYDVSIKAYDKDGKRVGKTITSTFKAKGEKGTEKIELKDVAAGSLLKFTIKDEDGNKVAELDGTKQGTGALTVQDSKEAEDGTKPQIKTSAELDVDVIQTGAHISDTIRYENLVPGTKYKVETSIICKETAEKIGDTTTSEFTADNAKGSYKVENIEVTDPDCLEQVVFEKLYDNEGNLVAVHEDIDDAAQTVGGGRDGKKKKKKDGEGIQVESPEEDPEDTPILGGKGTPKPKGDLGTPNGGGAGGGRASIGSVPSGQLDGFGYTLFG